MSSFTTGTANGTVTIPGQTDPTARAGAGGINWGIVADIVGALGSIFGRNRREPGTTTAPGAGFDAFGNPPGSPYYAVGPDPALQRGFAAGTNPEDGQRDVIMYVLLAVVIIGLGLLTYQVAKKR